MEGLLRLGNVAIFCLFLFLTTNGASNPTEILEDNKNSSIIYPASFYLVGVADGKSFFVDNENRMNWTDAKAYCESMNMQLASITSQAQAIMLNNSWDENNFKDVYWTSARDALDLSQFVWDHNLVQPDSAYNAVGWKGDIHHMSCLAYHSRSGTSSLSILPCTYYFRFMCDTGNHNLP